MKNLAILLFTLLLVSCGPSDKELASRLINQANKLKRESNYNRTKILLDSLKTTYPKEKQMVIQAGLILTEIGILEQKHNITYLDSLLNLKQRELRPLLLNFVVSVDDQGGDTMLIHKRQRPENSFNRSYIRANLNSKGDFYLSSQYVGEANINHTNMKAICGQLTAQSAEFKEDGFANRHFEDEDTKWEVVCFKNGSDNGISDLIASHSDAAIHVELRGGAGYTIYLEDYDKEAIKDGYEISFVLKEIAKLKVGIADSKRALKKLSGK